MLPQATSNSSVSVSMITKDGSTSSVYQNQSDISFMIYGVNNGNHPMTISLFNKDEKVFESNVTFNFDGAK